MIIIINELSFAGQFPKPENFLKSLKPFIIILSALNGLQCEVYKNYNFFSAKITPNHSLGDLLRDVVVGSEEEIRGLRNQLVKFSYNPPFWEDEQVHNCNDTYDCKYTELKCNYGLAEAVETDKLVASFNHPDFLESILLIKKNSIDQELYNFATLDGISQWIIYKIEERSLSFKAEESFFPHIRTSNNLLSTNSFYEQAKLLSTDIKIAEYISKGHSVAIINGWHISKPATNKNDRTIYTKTLRSGTYYLSIDTAHGTFELFNYQGAHLGEYNFLYEKMENPKGHSIEI